MIHGYSHGIDPEPLRKAGATEIWYDPEGRRDKRNNMAAPGAMRDGDKLLIFSLHNLTGSPKTYDRWREDLAAIPVVVEVVQDDTPKRPRGRPRKKYTPIVAEAQQDHAIWTDRVPSEKERLAAIAKRYGAPVTRQTLNGRYGNPTNPKPAPTEEPSDD